MVACVVMRLEKHLTLLTENGTRNLPGDKGQPARKADLNAICGTIV
jgi:hypothetical protein